MSCEYCRRIVGHASSCPNFQSRTIGKCAECNDDILHGDEFIELSSGKQYHVDCLSYISIRKLLFLLDIDIQTTNHAEDDYNDYGF